MYEDILKIHKKICYGEEKTFSAQNNKSFQIYASNSSATDTPKSRIPKLELNAFGEDEVVNRQVNKNYQTAKKGNDYQLQQLSQELEFYSRRYGGDSL